MTTPIGELDSFSEVIMATAKSLPGFEGPAASFDEPFEMLDACHDKLRRSLELLRRLQQYLASHPADDKVQQAALDVMRYFTIAAPLHHEDEERHIVPLLRQSGHRPLIEAAEQLMQDHAQIRSVWRTLEPLLREVTRRQVPDLQRLVDTVGKFVRLNESHLSFESGIVFPKARQLKEGEGPEAVMAMGQEMAQRRLAEPQRG